MAILLPFPRLNLPTLFKVSYQNLSPNLFRFLLDNVEYWICVATDRFFYYYYPILFIFIEICFVTYRHLYLIFYSFTFCCVLMLFICCQFKKNVCFHRIGSKKTGAPNVNFRKISVRKTIWDLEFSEHLL